MCIFHSHLWVNCYSIYKFPEYPIKFSIINKIENSQSKGKTNGTEDRTYERKGKIKRKCLYAKL